jgi:transcriptional regulator with XRE-family HTH domain
VKLDAKKTKLARELRGLSMEGAAEASGASLGTVFRAEHGREIRPPTARKLAEAYGVQVTDLLPEDDLPKGTAPPSQPSFNHLLEEERRESTLEQVRKKFLPFREALDRYTTRWQRRLKEGSLDSTDARFFFEDLADTHEFLRLAVQDEFWALVDAMGLAEEGHPYHQLPDDVVPGFIRTAVQEKSLLLPALERYCEVGLALAEQVGTEDDAEQMRRWRDSLGAAA